MDSKGNPIVRETGSQTVHSRPCLQVHNSERPSTVAAESNVPGYSFYSEPDAFRRDVYLTQEESHFHAITNDLLETYPVIKVGELHGQGTYSDLRMLVAFISQTFPKGQAEEHPDNITQASYYRLCSWKAEERSLSSGRPSVLRIQVLSLLLLFEQSCSLSNYSTRDALHRACQVMLQQQFPSSLTASGWDTPGLFDTWIVLSAAALLLRYVIDSYIATYLNQRSDTGREVTILQRYYLPYPRADQLAERFGSIGKAKQYTGRVQSMNERYLSLPV